MISFTSLLQGLGTAGLLAGALVIIQVILLDGILSVDNVAVLGTLVQHLPTKPLPATGLARFVPSRLRHSQRNAALTLGIVGAYVGRGLMLVGAKYIIDHPALRYVGAAYLVLLFWNHLNVGPKWLHPEPFWFLSKIFGKESSSAGFWSTVINVEMTDLAFSLDNVVAVVALSSNIWLVVAGTFVSILIIRFGARQFVKLVERIPALGHGAYLIIGFIGGRMIFEEATGFQFPDVAQFVVSISILVFFGVIGVLMDRRVRVQRVRVSERVH